ncbi:MAG: glycosyltransferase [Candidatus Dadabacteria bacterium]|nr:glycosyltransferase [Candidatus Dadabacteria bacterium]
MRRILFAYPEVSPIFPNGGIGTFVFEASRLLAGSGEWEVDILTDTTYAPYITQGDFRNAEKIFKDAGVRLIDLDRETPVLQGWESPDVTRSELYHAHIARLNSEKNYDIIEFPDWRAPGFFAVRHKRTTKSFSNTLIVAHLHSSTKDVRDWQDGYFLNKNDLYCHFMEEYVKKYSDVVISPTEFLLRPVRQTQHIFEKPLYRNGYPISSANAPISNTIARNSNSNVISVACVSRLELRKGQDVFAKAIKHLSESKYFDDRVQFTFCGRDNIGYGRDEWMSQSIRRILKGVKNWKIIKPKSRQDLAQWLASEVDICVVPSRGDNYPNVVMEASRAGCYVIASDAGGIPEILRDYKITGALFPSGDSHALEQEIIKAIKNVRDNPGIRSKISEMLEENRKIQANRTLSIYDEMAKHSEKRKALTVSKKANPRVSVIIPFYNSHQNAIDTIQSAFASNYPDFEVILVNDGSDSQESLEFLKEAEKQFPNLIIIHKQNGGIGDTLNTGINFASGEFILPVHADNILLPNMLPCCSRVLSERQNLAYVTTYFECVREDQARIPWQLSHDPKPLGAVEPFVLMENTIGNTPAMIRKSALESVGGYSTNLFGMEDWDLWLKFHEKGLGGDVLQEVHYIHRLQSDGISHSLNALNGVRLKQSVLRKHERLLKEHSLAIASLFLNEYKHEGLGPDEDWTLLKDMLRRAVQEPRLTFGYMAGKLKRGMRKEVSNLHFVKTLIGFMKKSP